MIIRPFTCFCAALAMASGFFLYTKKHQTALLDQEIAGIIHQTKDLQAETSTLRTEWTLENQPDRLEQLAYRYAPYLHVMNPSQFMRLTDLEEHLPNPKGFTIQHKKPQDSTSLPALNHQYRNMPHERPETRNMLIATNGAANHLLTPIVVPPISSKDKEIMPILVSTETSHTIPIKTHNYRIFHPHQGNLFHHIIATTQNAASSLATTLTFSSSHTIIHRFSDSRTPDFKTMGMSSIDTHHSPTHQANPIIVAEGIPKPISHSLPITAATWHFVRKRKVVDQLQTESHTAFFRGSIFDHETRVLPPPVPVMR